jgi:hypothetical protein
MSNGCSEKAADSLDLQSISALLADIASARSTKDNKGRLKPLNFLNQVDLGEEYFCPQVINIVSTRRRVKFLGEKLLDPLGLSTQYT